MFVYSFLITCIPLLTSSASLSDNENMFKAINDAVNTVRERSSFVDFFAEEKKVCYGELGCFTTLGPLKNIGYLPEKPEKIDTKFDIYTKSSPTAPHVIRLDDPLTNVPQGTQLAIVIHGFTNNGQTSYLLALKDALLTQVPTVIVTDWGNGAHAPWYLEAATNTQLVGRQVAILVNKLKTSRGINPEHVHLLGFSLGAQVAHFAGQYSQQQFHWKFGRITAMDAAAPMFEDHEGAYLTRDDATFVDAIHTSAGTNLLLGDVGFRVSVGHVDFYPNGGKKQPKCAGHLLHIACNHESSVEYATATISARGQCHFNAYHCNSWDEFDSGKCKDTKGDSEMGYFSIKSSARGDHFLRTSKAFPFCDVH